MPLIRICTILSAFFLLALRVYSQTQCVPVFNIEYNATGHLQPQDIKQLSDGNYLLAGRGSLSSIDARHALLMKLSSTGDILWSNILASGTESVCSGIVLLANGDYLVHGVMQSGAYPNSKSFLARITSTGNVVWSRQLLAGQTGKDRIKDIKELNNGDFIGIMNQNDSSSQSNAVVFRLSATGNILWNQVFDHGSEDAFTSLAVDNGIIYAGGFYTSEIKRGIIVSLNESGTMLSSTNITHQDDIDEYITDLEVKGGLVSYGLRLAIPGLGGKVVLIQQTMGGKKVFSRGASLSVETECYKALRTPDQGFMMLLSYEGSNSTFVTKMNKYASGEWNTHLSGESYIKIHSYAMDISPDGGSISAGYFTSGMSDINKMRIVRTNKDGLAGGCGYEQGGGLHTDTAKVSEKIFSWSNQFNDNDFQSLSNNITISSIIINKDEKCAKSVCVDTTPLPPGCGKTYRIEYSSGKNLLLRDVITASDGGKIAVGMIGYDDFSGVVVKFNINGDIAWSKSYQEFFHNAYFTRILRSSDNNLFVFANDYYSIGYYGYNAVKVIKMTNNGDVIWSKNFMYRGNSQMLDVTATPDNGFALMLTDGHGSGSTFAQLMRFDAQGSITWKKELIYSYGSPIYKSISCNTNHIYVAHDSYSSGTKFRFGVDKFSLQTGEKIWSKRYDMDDEKLVYINRIFDINDTAYVFVNHFDPVDFWNATYNTVMLKLNPDGKINQSFTITSNQVKLPKTHIMWDQSPPTITLTPNFDFVMANKIFDGSTDGFNISRFTKDGTKVWSWNYKDLSKYSPHNIHSQGNGFIVVGAIESDQISFNKSFLIKVDSAGLIESGPQCMPEDASISKFNTKINPGDSLIENITDADIEIWDSEILSKSESVDATQYCHETGNCGNVGFLQKGTGCSLTDTLVYYLLDPRNCDAAATWQYDPSFFKPLSIDAYSLQLIPLKKGVSSVKAIIEGNCTITEKNITTSTLLSASEMSLGKDTVICNEGNVRLSAGTGYATYLWNDNNSSTDSVLTVSVPGIYAVTVTDNCGNSKKDSIAVTDASTEFHLTNDTSRCNEETILLSATAGLSNYEWLPDYKMEASGNHASVTPDVTTTYVVKAKNNAGCIVSDSVKVTTIQTPRVQLGNDTALCQNETHLLSAGNDFDTYLWNNGQTTSERIVTEQGEYWVKAVKDGCATYDTLLVTEIKPLPVFTLGNDTVICENTGLKYNFNLPASSYKWSNGNSTGNNYLTAAGNYWLTVTQRGCAASDTININIRPAPAVFLGMDTTLCEGETKVLSPGNTGSYKWQNGSTSTSYEVVEAGNYFVTVTQNECASQDSIKIGYRYKPKFTLGKDTSLCNGMEIKLEAGVNDADVVYKWQDESALPYYNITQQGIYTLTVSNECGYSSDSILITAGICNLIMPNAFTPDNNGLNDIFRVKYVFPVKQFIFTIFNRWGHKVFETNDMSKGWDGSYNGTPEPTGIFVWKILIEDGAGNKQNASGTVNLIR